jgi:hypothetical protein
MIILVDESGDGACRWLAVTPDAVYAKARLSGTAVAMLDSVTSASVEGAVLMLNGVPFHVFGDLHPVSATAVADAVNDLARLKRDAGGS